MTEPDHLARFSTDLVRLLAARDQVPEVRATSTAALGAGQLMISYRKRDVARAQSTSKSWCSGVLTVETARLPAEI